MHKLSNRMYMNVSLIPTGKNVADIGCDHGWVSIYLIQNNLAKKVFAMDVATGPLDGAREHIIEAGLEDRIETRLSDGLEKLLINPDGKLEADIILMAGIGGQLAVRLIQENIEKCRACEAIVLQAQSELDYVREKLCELGFSINAEDMVYEDGKYYTAMRLIPVGMESKRKLSPAELKYGPLLIRNKPEVFRNFLKFRRAQYLEILDNISENSTAPTMRGLSIRDELHIIDSIYEMG